MDNQRNQSDVQNCMDCVSMQVSIKGLLRKKYWDEKYRDDKQRIRSKGW